MSPPPEIRETLIEMCRPFGRIEHCALQSNNDGLFRCAVRLVEPHKHGLLARTLGGTLRNGEVLLDIRVRPGPLEEVAESGRDQEPQELAALHVAGEPAVTMDAR
jgi:hypothetical protein